MAAQHFSGFQCVGRHVPAALILAQDQPFTGQHRQPLLGMADCFVAVLQSAEVGIGDVDNVTAGNSQVLRYLGPGLRGLVGDAAATQQEGGNE